VKTDDKQCEGNGTQSQDELLHQIADGEAQIQIKSRLMENMAYQIRTLSNAVIGFSDLLLCEDLSESQVEYVQEINRSGYGLSALVNEVLDWSGVLAGNLKTQKTPFDLSEMIDRLEPILAAATKEKGLEYQIVRDGCLPNQIVADEERLMRCLLNLVANAVRNTQEGSVQIHIVMEERHWKGRTVRFDVIDSGKAIDAEAAADLFELKPDSQVCSDQGLTVLLDMGLKITAGLPLTQQLIESLGGQIEIQSPGGSGTTFSLRIPVGIAPIASPSSAESKKEWSPMPVKPLLLVEDQQANRTVISLMLEALGVEVDTAVDGEEAICKVGENEYSLILMDLKMPKMDGYEAARQLRGQDIQVPIVALSAKVLDSNENQQIKSLFDGFLMKPVDSQKLAEMLGEFVAGFGVPEQEGVVLEYEN
jgi:CheY-like chemotaxis protein/nitrogen-specific signal transduction histidine kinase